MAKENDVYKLHGIGPKYTGVLEKIGVDSIKELRHRKAASLKKMIETRHGKMVGLSEERVQGWIDQAKAWDFGSPAPARARKQAADRPPAPTAPEAATEPVAQTAQPEAEQAETDAAAAREGAVYRRSRYLRESDEPDPDEDALPATPEFVPAAAAPEPEPEVAESSARERNEALVQAMFEAWADFDEEALQRLVADDVVFRLAGEEPYLGRDAVFAVWNRQDELLEDVAYEAKLHGLSATDDHVFTYVETWGKVPGTGNAFNYTTVTVYHIRDGQVVEVRPHVHNLDAYEEFWSSLAGDAGTRLAGPGGPPAAGADDQPPQRKPGFAKYRLY